MRGEGLGVRGQGPQISQLPPPPRGACAAPVLHAAHCGLAGPGRRGGAPPRCSTRQTQNKNCAQLCAVSEKQPGGIVSVRGGNGGDRRGAEPAIGVVPVGVEHSVPLLRACGGGQGSGLRVQGAGFRIAVGVRSPDPVPMSDQTHCEQSGREPHLWRYGANRASQCRPGQSSCRAESGPGRSDLFGVRG